MTKFFTYLSPEYVVSIHWQKEFKFECNMILASISDQCQLGYLALQNTVEAMKELTEDNHEPQKKPSTLKQKPGSKPVDSKQSKLCKKGVYQLFDLTSKSHLNSRLWLKARLMFIQYMFNQLNDAGKAKGTDDNIISDFGDLNYYCDKVLNETDRYYDNEAKAFIQFILASVDLIRGVPLQACLEKLRTSLMSFLSCRQLSSEGLLNYLKTELLVKDIDYALGLMNSDNR